MLFASFLVVQGLQWQTVKAFLAAVRYLHLTMGFPLPGQDKSLPTYSFCSATSAGCCPTAPHRALLCSNIRRSFLGVLQAYHCSCPSAFVRYTYVLAIIGKLYHTFQMEGLNIILVEQLVFSFLTYIIYQI